MTRRKKTNKKLIYRISAVFLILIMMLGTFVGCGSAKKEDAQPGNEQTSSGAGNLRNPWKDEEGNTVWDCVWFGHYWQNDTNGDGKTDQNDDKAV